MTLHAFSNSWWLLFLRSTQFLEPDIPIFLAPFPSLHGHLPGSTLPITPVANCSWLSAVSSGLSCVWMLQCLGEEALAWVLFISKVKPDRGREGEAEKEGEGEGEAERPMSK